MRKLVLSSLAALALIAGSANVQPVKAEPIAFILGATYIALGGGAICAVLDVTGNSVCQGRDNAEWASTQYGKMPVPKVPTTDVAARQFVDGSYKSRLGL